jgi:hypothetical protein
MKQALLAVAIFAVLLGVVLATRDHGNVNVGVAKLELPTVDKAKVTSIELAGALTVTLKKEPSGWTVADASKVFHAADDGQVNGLLDALKDFKTEVFVTDRPERLGELEIDDAKGLAFKVFTDSGRPALDVVFGKQGKNGGAYLRAPNSNQVFVTNSRLAQEARHQPTRWRKRSVSPAKLDQLAKLTVKLGDGSSLALEAQADGKWALGAATPAPAGFRFDASAAQRVAATVGALWAIDFLDRPVDEAFAAPHATVEAQQKDGKAVVMHLGSPLPAATDGGQPSQAGTPVRIEGQPQAFVIATDQAALLEKRLTDLRDTTLLSFDPMKAQKLVISTAGKKTVVVKEAGVWKVVEPKVLPAGYEFEPSQVAGELAHLQSLRGEPVAEGVTDAKVGLARPSGTVEISVEGAAAQVLKFGAETPGKTLYVRGTADGLLYTIDRGALTRLESALELFKKPPPPPPNMGQMKGLDSLPPEIRRQLEAQLKQQGH